MYKHTVITRALISEKSMGNASRGQFAFLVRKDAGKFMIKNAIEEKFAVNVVSITTGITKGKTKRVGKRRQEVVLAGMKKAMVKLKEGEKIALFALSE